ncbi:MAG: hypothetical protein JWN86_4083 [Planctomycetota bacterium]|nr:hypothetical protein [Planctomycetota bacterium]
MSKAVVLVMALATIGLGAYRGSAQAPAPPPANPEIGRYQMVAANQQVFLIDTVTGQCWSRRGQGQWDDEGNPTRPQAEPGVKKAAIPPPPQAVPVEKFNDVQVKVGSPQFTLVWDSRADLDLHVIEPGGAEIFWEKRKGSKGGELDVDDVDGFGPENVFWNGGPDGSYRWFVHYYGGLGGLAVPTRWKLRIKQDGKVHVVEGNFDKVGEKSAVGTVRVEPKAPAAKAD